MHREVGRPCSARRIQYAGEVSSLGNDVNHGRQPKRVATSGLAVRCRALNSEALAALGAAGIDDGAATTRLHADQKAMGTSAAGFRSLVSAFHSESNCGAQRLQKVCADGCEMFKAGRMIAAARVAIVVLALPLIRLMHGADRG
jgi:hypothetical protein